MTAAVTPLRFTLLLLPLGLVSACVDLEESASLAPGGASSPGMQACLAAVSRQTNNSDVMLLDERDSEAGTVYTIGVGPQAAPWSCSSDSSGEAFNVMSLTDEGAL